MILRRWSWLESGAGDKQYKWLRSLRSDLIRFKLMHAGPLRYARAANNKFVAMATNTRPVATGNHSQRNFIYMYMYDARYMYTYNARYANSKILLHIDEIATLPCWIISSKNLIFFKIAFFSFFFQDHKTL